MTNYIELEDGSIIIVQSCDVDWANTGVFLGKGPVRYRHVSVPSLEPNQHEPPKPGAMSDETFGAILVENREAVLALIDRLNEVEPHPQQAALDLRER